MSADPYPTVLAQFAALRPDCRDRTAAMATAAALLMDGVEKISWVGFYLPQPDGSLSVGPYQGRVASTLLPPGQGVCGRAAATKRTVIVDDVHAFEGHIACDPRTRSEIVVPILDPAGELVGVLDCDSVDPAAFGPIDQQALEQIAGSIPG